MEKSIKLYDQVVLLEDAGKQDITPKVIHQVVEAFSPDEFAVQMEGRKVHLRLDQVIVLRYEATINEEKFWQFIEEAKAESGHDSERQVQLLIDKVAAMPVADILAYSEIFHHLQNVTNQRELWSAALILNVDSNDSFTDFRAWLIAQGKQVFYDALRDPDTLADVVGDDVVELEEMNYVCYYAYEKKMGEEMRGYRYIEPRRALTGEWLDDVVCEKFPQLMRKFRPGRCDNPAD